MAISGISNTATQQPSSHHASQAAGHHRHGRHHGQSLSDIDAQGSSMASAPSSTGKTGSRVNVTA
jgi:hypothetical protein